MVHLAVYQKFEWGPHHREVVIDSHQRIMDSFFDLRCSWSSDPVRKGLKRHLSRLAVDQRSDQGPLLAQKLLFVIQRRGWVYFQEIPNQPDGLPYTWHADHDGRIVLERVHLPEGKDAWLVSKNTIKNLDAMYQAARSKEPDARYVQLGRVVAPVSDAIASGSQRPSGVAAQFGDEP